MQETETHQPNNLQNLQNGHNGDEKEISRLAMEPQGQASNAPHPEGQNPWNDLALDVMLGEQADMDRRKALLSTAIQARSQYLELVAPSA